MHPHETTDGSVEQTMLSVLDSIGRRFDAMSTRFFLVIIGAIAALRVGVAGVGPNFLRPLTN